MSTTNEPGTNQDNPYAPVPEADDPSRGQEVWAPVGVPFEVQATEIIPGPFYAEAEERMPEIAEGKATAADADADAATASKTFPVDRRDFMKLFSMATVAATSACVQRPVEKIVPYVNQPLDEFPGAPVWYASTCGECSAGCGIMVRTREGRPTKLEGLPEHPISNGRLCAVGQASIQGLYHPNRRTSPAGRFGDHLEPISWNDSFQMIAAKLAKTSKVGILTRGSTGHRLELFREFLEKIGAKPTNLYTFEPNLLYETVTAAHDIAFGVKAIPRYDLQKARLVVGVGADFLDIGTSLVYNTKTYTDMHAYKNGDKGRHVQFESAFTLTGARSDERFVIPPGTETLTTLLIVRSLLANSASKGSAATRAVIQKVLDHNAGLLSGGEARVGVTREAFDRLAADMLAVPTALLAGGSYNFDENATMLQLAAIMANELLGAYDSILMLSKGWQVPPVQVGDLKRFLTEAPELDVLFVVDANPIFALPPSWGMLDTLKKVPTVISVQDFPNDVDEVAAFALNSNHPLESWGDAEPVAGFWSMRQPGVRTTTDSRQTEEIFMWIAAELKKPLGYADARDWLKKKFHPIYKTAGSKYDEATFFDAALHRGFLGNLASQAVGAMRPAVAEAFKPVDTSRDGLTLIAPLDFRLHAGENAHIPVLQEAADTLTTITWDTWVGLSPITAAKLGLRKFDVVKVQGPAGSFEASVYPLPGLHANAVVVPRGNGHTTPPGVKISVEGNVGVDPLVAFTQAQDAVTGAPVTVGQSVKITSTGRVFQLAQLQKHNDLANRKDIVKVVSLETAAAKEGFTRDLDKVPDIFPALPKGEHRWSMSIDLSRCTGCQACYVACSLENNVPQVGRDQIMIGRMMHWIKIDRYFYGSVDNPHVALQPMLCQHCMHAPCEAVCPVLATSHDPEGINTMVYNRCIGTRYCANACPYKIRRFNWWTHRWNMIGERLQDRNPRALNPDVTVRTRGVMEKCNFCYQRVREARHKQKITHKPIDPRSLQTACQQTCPADAIRFGDLFDPNGPTTKQRKEFRTFLVLNGDPDKGEYGLKTLPNVSYLAKVVQTEEEARIVSGEEG